MNENLVNLLSADHLIPIIRSGNPNVVRDVANAIIDGGAKLVEINITSPEIYEVIQELSKHVTICAGGVITTMQAHASVNAGAKVLSSPIFQMNLVKFSKDKRIPYIPGTSTANEAYSAWKSRIPLIKIYPISAMGGTDYLSNLLRPMPFLNIIAQGDVKLCEVKKYVEAGALAVGVGRDIYEGFNFTEITKRIKATLEELRI